ncbi:MAG: alpha/beta-hydrolase family protein [Actinomycetota bacterium]
MSHHHKRMRSRAEAAGMFVAAAAVPGTFQKTLMPRSTMDQGLITGTTMALDYALATLIQDGIESIAFRLANAQAEDETVDLRWRRVAMAMDLGAIAAGFALQSRYRQQPDETIAQATARTAGWWLSSAAGAGFAVGLTQEILRSRRPDREFGPLSLALPAAGLLAAGIDLRRRMEEKAAGTDGDEDTPITALKSLATGAGVTVGLFGLTKSERMFAHTIASGLSKFLPGSPRFWRPAGHVAALGIAGFTIKKAVEQAYKGIEDKAEKIEPAFAEPPTSPLMSGSPASHVKWDTLSKQGRRHVSTALHPDWIKKVMGKKAKTEPIRIFVGIDSAATETERVQLAMDEIERTNAFDREILMVISPTGTGYVNYVAVESTEYMTLGNSAAVTLQYSKRPSFLSLDRAGEGEEQYRMLIEAIDQRLRDRPKNKRPKVVAFGESLGAWTSQDAFEGTGTVGLQAHGLDRALWIGSPFAGKWHKQIHGPASPDIDPALIGEFNSFEDVEALTPSVRDAIRYVMISHDNDAVVHFSPDLAVQAPYWLQDPAWRPASVPKSERWWSPITFVQTLVDMKNAANVVPGVFEAKGHDYRADLAPFVRWAYGLTATGAQLKRIVEAMRRYELERADWIKEMDKRPDKQSVSDGPEPTEGSGQTTPPSPLKSTSSAKRAAQKPVEKRPVAKRASETKAKRTTAKRSVGSATKSATKRAAKPRRTTRTKRAPKSPDSQADEGSAEG